MSIPDNILNPALYKKAKELADKTYKRHGLFKSAFIQKKYQEFGENIRVLNLLKQRAFKDG